MRAMRDTTAQTVTIGPQGSERATELLNMAESMLGWRLKRAGLEPKQEAVRVYILGQYPLLGRAPNCQEITDRFGCASPSEAQGILE